MLLGGVIGAGITWTVIKSMDQLGPAKAALLIVISQLIVAYVIELLGLFGVDKTPLEWKDNRYGDCIDWSCNFPMEIVGNNSLMIYLHRWGYLLSKTERSFLCKEIEKNDMYYYRFCCPCCRAVTEKDRIRREPLSFWKMRPERTAKRRTAG